VEFRLEQDVRNYRRRIGCPELFEQSSGLRGRCSCKINPAISPTREAKHRLNVAIAIANLIVNEASGRNAVRRHFTRLSRTDLSETWSRGTSLPNYRVYVSRFPPGRLFKIRNVVYATSRCEVLLQISSRRDIFVTISGASVERIRIKLDFCNNLPNEMNRDGLSIFHRHSSIPNFAPSRLIRSIKFDSAIRLWYSKLNFPQCGRTRISSAFLDHSFSSGAVTENLGSASIFHENLVVALRYCEDKLLRRIPRNSALPIIDTRRVHIVSQALRTRQHDARSSWNQYRGGSNFVFIRKVISCSELWLLCLLKYAAEYLRTFISELSHCVKCTIRRILMLNI